MSLPEDNFDRRIRKLRKFLTTTEDGGYVFASFSYGGLWLEIIRMLQDQTKANGFQLRWLVLDPNSDEPFMYQVEKAAEQISKPGGLVITGLTRGTLQEQKDLLFELNLGRERFHATGVPILFFVDDKTMNLVQNNAPDLYSQRGRTTVFFPEQPEPSGTIAGEVAPTIGVESLRSVPESDFRFSADDKGLGLRVKLLERQWKDGEKSQMRKGRLYEDIGIPLAEGYLDLGRMDEAEKMLLKLEGYFDGSGREKELGQVYKMQGNRYERKGMLDQAMEYYEKFRESCQRLLQKDPHWEYAREQYGSSLSHIGDIHQALGHFDDALKYYQDYSKLMEELYRSNPQSERFKNGLALSCDRLGDVHRALGQLDVALNFFQEYSDLMVELHRSNPQNEQFKNGLAVSYDRLGDVNIASGHLNAALKYYKDESDLFDELHCSNPQSERFKINLAISHAKLGDIHQASGRFDAALKYFQDYSDLTEELYHSNPQSERLKNGLGISYLRLGDIHQAIGQFEDALKYYQKDLKLTEDLHRSNPQNIDLLWGFCLSHARLYSINQHLQKSQSARLHLKIAEELLHQLLKKADLPQYRDAIEWIQQQKANLNL